MLVSCAGEAPALHSLDITHLLLVPTDASEPRSALWVSVGVDEPDGLGDLVEVYVINDAEQLHWALEAGAWRETELPGGPGIVLPPLALPDASPAPAGRYRVQVIDAGGRTAEQEISLPLLREPISLPDGLADLSPANLHPGNLPTDFVVVHSDGGRLVEVPAAGDLAGAEISLVFPDPDRGLVVQWGPLRLPADSQPRDR